MGSREVETYEINAANRINSPYLILITVVSLLKNTSSSVYLITILKMFKIDSFFIFLALIATKS